MERWRLVIRRTSDDGTYHRSHLEAIQIQYNHDHVGRMLHRLGFSCQKPAKQAKEHDEKAARVWRKREWPRIKKGRRIEASFVFIDESGFMLQPLARRHLCQTWPNHQFSSVGSS